ncbi:MAG: hypothetical protein RLZZ617_868, partial [Bacteroidota bacterium]
MSLRQITQNPFIHWFRFFFSGLIGGVILALVGLFGRVHAQSTEELTKNLPPRLETEGVLYEFKSLRDGGLPP